MSKVISKLHRQNGFDTIQKKHGWPRADLFGLKSYMNDNGIDMRSLGTGITSAFSKSMGNSDIEYKGKNNRDQGQQITEEKRIDEIGTIRSKAIREEKYVGKLMDSRAKAV